MKKNSHFKNKKRGIGPLSKFTCTHGWETFAGLGTVDITKGLSNQGRRNVSFTVHAVKAFGAGGRFHFSVTETLALRPTRASLIDQGGGRKKKAAGGAQPRVEPGTQKIETAKNAPKSAYNVL